MLMEKVLLVSTVPGLESYSIGVIRAAFQNGAIDCYACVFLPGTDRSTIAQSMDRYGLPQSGKDKVLFHKLATNKILRNLRSCAYLRQIVDFAHQHQIHKVHFIAQDVMLYGNFDQFKDFELYYTVHDLVPHEVKLSLFQRLKHYYFRIRKDKVLTQLIDQLVTNSSYQKEALQQLYPNKTVFFHAMPSVVTPAIQSGSADVPELKELNEYALFFGRIEVYKGIGRLYQDFVSRPELKAIKLKLVIAGRGQVYFKRDNEQEDNIIFINRFIREEEIGALFKHARMIILPYDTATQSAVSSLSYHYHKPVIASDIDGLRDSVIHEKTGLLYDPALPDALCEAVLRLHSDQNLSKGIIKYLSEEEPFFDEKKIGDEMAAIYNHPVL